MNAMPCEVELIFHSLEMRQRLIVFPNAMIELAVKPVAAMIVL